LTAADGVPSARSAQPATPEVPAPAVTVEAVAWDDAGATALRVAQQAELAVQYGRGDLVALTAPDDITAMLVVRVDGVPSACGALRDRGDGVGEVKRMFVRPEQRGRGLSRMVLTELERRATELGWQRLILETGELQPAAIGLYRSAGYAPIPNYAPYEAEADSWCFAKAL